jgi:hypothetical protein
MQLQLWLAVMSRRCRATAGLHDTPCHATTDPAWMNDCMSFDTPGTLREQLALCAADTDYSFPLQVQRANTRP